MRPPFFWLDRDHTSRGNTLWETLRRAEFSALPSVTWSVYRCTNLGMRSEPKDLRVEGRRARVGEGTKPPPPVPDTPAQAAIRAIHRADSLSTPLRPSPLLDQVLQLRPAREAMQSISKRVEAADLCIAAIATNPEKREHLIRCAASRRRAARTAFARLMGELEAAAPCPRFTIVGGAS